MATLDCLLADPSRVDGPVRAQVDLAWKGRAEVIKRWRLCHTCGKEGLKAFYAGIPFRVCMCNGDRCPFAFGPLSFLLWILPFNGVIMLYEGSYLRALWRFLLGKDAPPPECHP